MIQNKHLLFSIFIVSLTVSAHSFDITVFVQSVKKNTQNFSSSLKESLHSNRPLDYALLDYYNGESITVGLEDNAEKPIPANFLEIHASKKEEIKKEIAPRIMLKVIEKNPAVELPIEKFSAQKEPQKNASEINTMNSIKQEEVRWSSYAKPEYIGGAVILSGLVFWFFSK